MRHDERIVREVEAAIDGDVGSDRARACASQALDRMRVIEDMVLDRKAMEEVVAHAILAGPTLRVGDDTVPAMARGVVDDLLAEYHACLREEDPTEVVPRRAGWRSFR
jgi:hypothetical protein